jgi:NAD+ kinase
MNMSAPIKRVVILADGSKPTIPADVDRLRKVIQQHVEIVGISLDSNEDLAGLKTDLAIVLGGDGSILRASHQIGYLQIPVLGVNLGKLGFLAHLQPEQLDEVLPKLVAGEFAVTEHLMFECRVFSGGKERSKALGLNEASVLAGPPFTILEVQLYIDGDLVTTYSCDGVIVSTPVGSTAYNLSAGGPILHKNLQAFAISPLNPHTLTNRPVVDSADRVYELVVPEPHEGTSLVVDGRVETKLTAKDRVRIERAKAAFRMVEVGDEGYYHRLRQKLGWGGQLKLQG